MIGLLRGLMGMGVVMTVNLNSRLSESLRGAGGRKVPARSAANRAAAIGMLTAWAMMARAKQDVAFYSRMGM
ncbi:hypothetical protein D1823_13310 [Ruegeria sp. AD91A]|nr:hypothetical protein D1823_13310 [Ruegeria sp. AD91A]